MITNGASRVNIELGINASLFDNISKDALGSWASTDVT